MAGVEVAVSRLSLTPAPAWMEFQAVEPLLERIMVALYRIILSVLLRSDVQLAGLAQETQLV